MKLVKSDARVYDENEMGGILKYDHHLDCLKCANLHTEQKATISD